MGSPGKCRLDSGQLEKLDGLDGWIVTNGSVLLSSGRRFGKVGLVKLAYGKYRLKAPPVPLLFLDSERGTPARDAPTPRSAQPAPA